MTKREVKDYLQNYRTCMARIQRLKTDIDIFTASASSIREEMEDCRKVCQNIEKHISQHKDFMEREILIRKYIYGDTVEEIADAMNYSERQIQRIADKGILRMAEALAV